MLYRFKDHKKMQGKFYFSFPVGVAISEDNYPSDFLTQLFREESFEVELLTDAPIRFVVDSNLNGEEYKINITNQSIVLSYNSKLSARNAAVTFFNLIKNDKDGYYVDCCEIFDYPSSKYRSVLLDPARGKISVTQVKETLKNMAMAKFNYMHFHLSDWQGYALESKCYPQLNEDKNKYYTTEEIKEILDYAEFCAIEVVPELDIPAHGIYITKKLKELKCNTGDIPASDWVVCIGREDTYKILTDLLGEVIALFPSEYVHIGTDELEFLDMPSFQRWVPWDDCVYCKARKEKENLKNYRDLFYYFVNRIHSYLKENNKKTIMWNDSIDISVSPSIPREILIQYWRVAHEGRGPVDGCSLRRFLEEGFTVINSDYPNAYIDLYIEEDKLVKWTPYSTPLSTIEEAYQEEIKKEPLVSNYKDSIIGGEMCAWENKKHFPRNFPQVILMFGARLWDFTEQSIDEEYRVALTRAVLGPKTPAGFNLFEILGACILPYEDDILAVESKKINSNQINTAIAILNSLISNGICSVNAAQEYTKCLMWLKERKDI